MSMIEPTPHEPVDVEDRVSFTPAQRAKVLAAGGGICDRCDCDLTGQEWHVDHVLARALGGKHEPSNWVPICIPCHAVKTRQDRERIHKAKRLARDRDPETRRQSPNKLRSRGFTPADPLRVR